MKKECDFSGARRNPYARRLKKQITIRLEEATIDYFKELAEQMDMPYQTLINLYLRDCADSGRNLRPKWVDTAPDKVAESET
ncbi:MAG: BrnA antitoxin family protein [Gammaproteobacteria bacterium]|nr:BrnA antitoxin family protein [Gammaproteobacteria bacterium]